MAKEKPQAYIRPLAVRPRLNRVQPRGLPIINLSFNELPFPPSPAVLSAINTATANAHCYGSPACDLLKTAIGNTYQIDENRVICGNGSEELLDIIGRCFAATGDEIVISEYGYIQFPIVANRVGASLVKARERDFTSNVDNILAAVTEKTKIVFLANPNNPTGTMISEEELKRLSSTLPSNIVLVIDLAYGEFVSNTYNAHVRNMATQFDNVVVTQTFSKAFGLAGLRVGWCYAPDWMIPILNAARGMGTVNAAAQTAALAALDNLKTVAEWVNVIKNERTRVANALEASGYDVIPSSTNFLMTAPIEGDHLLADKLAIHLFDHAGIIVNQTREAGLERFIRFSLSTVSNNDLLLNSLYHFAQTHK